jgi:hypothetical protein
MDTQELLHLSIEIMREGTLFLKEFAFMGDGFVFTRTSMIPEHHDEDSWNTTGWNRLNGPDGNPICFSLDILERIANHAKRTGWTVELNINHEPAFQEYVRSAGFKI